MYRQDPDSAKKTLFDLQDLEGVNESERVLNKLCQNSFMRLWAQSNVFTNEGFKNGRGSTKELCDVLIIFGNDILIFSDKHIKFQEEKELNIAWSRWYKRAVADSIRQLYGAKNWLVRFPERIFLDGACTRKLPVSIPIGPEAKIHLIAVTRGSRAASLSANNGEGFGSLRINTSVRGDKHFKAPFTIGQHDVSKGFVHVFDEVTVELLLKELDTAADFIAYINERERVIGSPNLSVHARGEEDLLAFYMQTMDASGSSHKLFDLPESGSGLVLVDDKLFECLQENPAYLRKKEADAISYEWDKLVEKFIEYGDPTLHEAFVEQNASVSEKGLRLLAAEGRFRRRQLADKFIAALRRTGPGERLGRVIYSGVVGETVFIFLVVPKQDDETYEAYRRYRAGLLHAYCRIAKLQAPLGTEFVGIGFDNIHKNYSGGSQDLMVYSQSSWTEDDIKELEFMSEKLGILGPNLQISRLQETEFPIAKQPTYSHRTQEPSSVARKKNSTEKNKRKMQKKSRRLNR